MIYVFVDNGGIYLDTDTIAIKSLDPLRKYGTTMASDQPLDLSTGVILAEPYSPFLCMFLHNYHNYRPGSWGGNSVLAAFRLYKTFPDLINREPGESFYNPGYTNKDGMFNKHVNLSNNYAIHIFEGGYEKRLPKEVGDIDLMDNTLGDVMKLVFYGKMY